MLNHCKPKLMYAPCFLNKFTRTGALAAMLLAFSCANLPAGDAQKPDPEPPVVEPGPPPSDAMVLFDGKDLSLWESEDNGPAKWQVKDGVMTVVPHSGYIHTKAAFGSCQLHIEWASPSVVTGEGQGRGNSGVYLMGRYEIQVLDSFQNKTYPNGQCGALYGHSAPLVNACRKPGEWQSYDIIFHPPELLEDGSVQAGSCTVMHNGVLIQDHIPVGDKPTTAAPLNGLASKGPLYLQDHGNPVRFRNVWIRQL